MNARDALAQVDTAHLTADEVREAQARLQGCGGATRCSSRVAVVVVKAQRVMSGR